MLAIALTGFVLPPLILIGVWLCFTVFDMMPLARARLSVMLTPGSFQEIAGSLFLLLLFAAPFLVQAISALRILSEPSRSKRLRATWRIGGCFAGLCLATLAVFVFVVPFASNWVNPGLGAPTRIFGVYYGLAIVLGALGGLVAGEIGRRLSRRHRSG